MANTFFSLHGKRMPTLPFSLSGKGMGTSPFSTHGKGGGWLLCANRIKSEYIDYFHTKMYILDS